MLLKIFECFSSFSTNACARMHLLVEIHNKYRSLNLGESHPEELTILFPANQEKDGDLPKKERIIFNFWSIF